MTAAPTRAAWQNPRVVSTLALVFCAGVATGALWMQFGLHDKLHKTVSAASSSPIDRDTLLRRFNAELQLSPDQSQKISGVLEDYTQYYQSLQDQLDDMRATGKTQILGILTQEQQSRFEKLMDELGPELQQQRKK